MTSTPVSTNNSPIPFGFGFGSFQQTGFGPSLYGSAGSTYNAAQPQVGMYGGFNRFSPYGNQFNLGYTGFGAWGGFGYGTYKRNCLDLERENYGGFGFWGPRMRANPCLPDEADEVDEREYINPVFGYSNPFGGWAMGYAEPGYGGWGVWGSANTPTSNPYIGNILTGPDDWRQDMPYQLYEAFGSGWNLNYGYNPYLGLKSVEQRSYGPGPYFNGNYMGANRIIAQRGLNSFGQLNNFYGIGR